MMTQKEQERIYKKASRNYNREQRRKEVDQRRLIRKSQAESNEGLQAFLKATAFGGYAIILVIILALLSSWMKLY